MLKHGNTCIPVNICLNHTYWKAISQCLKFKRHFTDTNRLFKPLNPGKRLSGYLKVARRVEYVHGNIHRLDTCRLLAYDAAQRP